MSGSCLPRFGKVKPKIETWKIWRMPPNSRPSSKRRIPFFSSQKFFLYFFLKKKLFNMLCNFINKFWMFVIFRLIANLFGIQLPCNSIGFWKIYIILFSCRVMPEILNSLKWRIGSPIPKTCWWVRNLEKKRKKQPKLSMLSWKDLTIWHWKSTTLNKLWIVYGNVIK